MKYSETNKKEARHFRTGKKFWCVNGKEVVVVGRESIIFDIHSHDYYFGKRTVPEKEGRLDGLYNDRYEARLAALENERIFLLSKKKRVKDGIIGENKRHDDEFNRNRLNEINIEQKKIAQENGLLLPSFDIDKLITDGLNAKHGNFHKCGIIRNDDIYVNCFLKKNGNVRIEIGSYFGFKGVYFDIGIKEFHKLPHLKKAVLKWIKEKVKETNDEYNQMKSIGFDLGSESFYVMKVRKMASNSQDETYALWIEANKKSDGVHFNISPYRETKCENPDICHERIIKRENIYDAAVRFILEEGLCDDSFQFEEIDDDFVPMDGVKKRIMAIKKQFPEIALKGGQLKKLSEDIHKTKKKLVDMISCAKPDFVQIDKLLINLKGFYKKKEEIEK